jgi:hypothetical protein
MMKDLKRLLVIFTLLATAIIPIASADNKAAAIDEMEGYLEFVDYGGAVIFPDQIPKEEWKAKGGLDAYKRRSSL